MNVSTNPQPADGEQPIDSQPSTDPAAIAAQEASAQQPVPAPVRPASIPRSIETQEVDAPGKPKMPDWYLLKEWRNGEVTKLKIDRANNRYEIVITTDRDLLIGYGDTAREAYRMAEHKRRYRQHTIDGLLREREHLRTSAHELAQVGYDILAKYQVARFRQRPRTLRRVIVYRRTIAILKQVNVDLRAEIAKPADGKLLQAHQRIDLLEKELDAAKTANARAGLIHDHDAAYWYRAWSRLEAQRTNYQGAGDPDFASRAAQS